MWTPPRCRNLTGSLFGGLCTESFLYMYGIYDHFAFWLDGSSAALLFLLPPPPYLHSVCWTSATHCSQQCAVSLSGLCKRLRRLPSGSCLHPQYFTLPRQSIFESVLCPPPQKCSHHSPCILPKPSSRLLAIGKWLVAHGLGVIYWNPLGISKSTKPAKSSTIRSISGFFLPVFAC
jgi:hypothetical protein